VFLDDALTIAPSDCWRYALMASAPETDDNDFTFERFADVVNKDLNGMLGNFVSRVCKLTAKNFGNNVPEIQSSEFRVQSSELEEKVNQKIAELTSALENCEFRAAVTALRSLYAIGNEYMTATEPWTLVKNGDMAAAGGVLNTCFQLIDLYARVSSPFIPDAATKIQNIFAGKHDLSWPEHFESRIAGGEQFTIPENLFNRIDDETVANLIERFVPKDNNKIVPIVAKIVDVKNHPTKENLHILTVNNGSEDIQIVCGAPNVHAGMVGVLAPVGCVLPGSKKPIGQRTVAGVESFGMMCSAAELGVGSNTDEIVELGESAKIGEEYKG
jgi:tRNA-binding EMAP/Myf-like protein